MQLFGTDGVRGRANVALTPQIAFNLGKAAVLFLGKNILIGKDTRRSGDMLEASIVAGITSVGGNAFLAGIIPTPGVAANVAANDEYDGGIVISASHNPPEYNGIKFFDGAGYKLTEDREEELEKLYFSLVEGTPSKAESATTANLNQISGSDIGVSVDVSSEATPMYVTRAIDSIKGAGVDFSKIKVALDLGHGAAVDTTPLALEYLGVDFEAINTDFDGDNINVECGSTDLSQLIELVKKSGADIGIAHDGDADRTLAVTPDGEIVDGDVIEAICALHLKSKGELTGDTVVSTVMCNLGFRKLMEQNGINVITTNVGDKYVLESMLETGAEIGGEQSGHTIFGRYATTGDGLITTLQLIVAILASNRSFSELANEIPRYPQVLINVTVKDKAETMNVKSVQDAIRGAEVTLANNGRVLVRPSGTEPYIRVMVEAADEAMAQIVADTIVEAIKTFDAQ